MENVISQKRLDSKVLLVEITILLCSLLLYPIFCICQNNHEIYDGILVSSQHSIVLNISVLDSKLNTPLDSVIIRIDGTNGTHLSGLTKKNGQYQFILYPGNFIFFYNKSKYRPMKEEIQFTQQNDTLNMRKYIDAAD